MADVSYVTHPIGVSDDDGGSRRRGSVRRLRKESLEFQPVGLGESRVMCVLEHEELL